MDVKWAIVHAIDKSEMQQGARSIFSELPLPLDGQTQNLVDKLYNSYNRAGITYAVFDANSSATFPTQFNNFSTQYNQGSFLEFSKKATAGLTKIINSIPQAKGGYLVYADYSVDDRRHLSVFLIRNTEGMIFIRDDNQNSYVIDPQLHLDLDKLAMACRININKYHTGNGRYLSYIKRKMPDISEYFVTWIAATDQESNKIYTQHLYELISQADPPQTASGQQLSLTEFRREIHSYVNSSPSRQVNLDQLSQHFFQDPTYLRYLAEENEIPIDTEFQSDGRVMRRFVNIDVNSDGIHIKFSRGELDSKIRFDSENSNIVIIESEKFAGALRAEIESNES